MGYVLAAFVIGVVVGFIGAWVIKSKAQAAMAAEVAQMKQSATNAINKL